MSKLKKVKIEKYQLADFTSTVKSETVFCLTKNNRKIIKNKDIKKRKIKI
tara:strand:+ start:7430 stop:7579 length:150 start_codon:yes stop_codon:yes gene_type:complete